MQQAREIPSTDAGGVGARRNRPAAIYSSIARLGPRRGKIYGIASSEPVDGSTFRILFSEHKVTSMEDGAGGIFQGMRVAEMGDPSARGRGGNISGKRGNSLGSAKARPSNTAIKE